MIGPACREAQIFRQRVSLAISVAEQRIESVDGRVRDRGRRWRFRDTTLGLGEMRAQVMLDRDWLWPHMVDWPFLQDLRNARVGSLLVGLSLGINHPENSRQRHMMNRKSDATYG